MRNLLKAAVFKSLYFIDVQGRLRNKKHGEGRITTLCLHRISADNDHFFDPIKPERFEQLIQYALKHYEVISVHDVHGKPGKKPKLVLSFDDGYYDFYSNVLPVLKHYSLPSNHNIVTDIVNGKQPVIWTEKLNFLFNYFAENKPDGLLQLGGVDYSLKQYQSSLDSFYITVLKRLFELEHLEREKVLDAWLHKFNLKISPKRMMNWAEINECAQHEVTFGSHTKRHCVLTSIKNEVEMGEELIESKTEIEKNMGTEISILAPPNGLCDDHVLKQASLAGYKYVLGIGEHSFMKNTAEGLTFLSRLNLISEPQQDMILRIEELQSNLRKLRPV